MKNNPYQWIPTVYLMQGIPFALVTQVAPILYKNFHFANKSITFYTSLFILPWIFKFFFAPSLEQFSSKKKLAWASEASISFFILLLTLSIAFFSPIFVIFLLFFLIAFAGSIHDICVDGIYLEALKTQEQAKFIGQRSLYYQLGQLFCSGGIIWLIGINSTKLNWSWEIVFCGLAIFIMMISFYNRRYLPSSIILNSNEIIFKNYKKVILEFIKIPHLGAVLFFILFFNFSSIQISKILPLFMLDSAIQGGLNLSIKNVGILNGFVGIGSMLIGITVSGFLLAKWDLKKCLIPFILIMALGHASYFILFSNHPTFCNISFCVILSELAYGLGNGAYMFYLVKIFAKNAYSMSLYAMGTAIMLLGNMIASSLSGYFQSILGYPLFFVAMVIFDLSLIFLAFYQIKKVL